MYFYTQKQRKKTTRLFNLIVILTLIIGSLFRFNSIRANAAPKRAKLMDVKISLENGPWLHEISTEGGTTCYIVKGTTSRFFITPIFSDNISNYKVSNRVKCGKKSLQIIKLTKSGRFKARRTGVAYVTITTKVKKTKHTHNQKKRSRLKIVVIDKNTFIQHFKKKNPEKEKTTQNTLQNKTAVPNTLSKDKDNGSNSTKASKDVNIKGQVPDYWKSYLNNKISTLKKLDDAIGTHGFSFVFITDLHWKDNNKNSPALIKHILDNTSVKTVIGGGDILNEEPSIDTAMNVLYSWQNASKELNIINLYGNHDNNSNSNNKNSLWLGYNRWYNTMLKPIEKMITLWSSDNKDFYIDNKEQKVRMIFLNTGFDQGTYLKPAQADWLEKVLQNTESGWKAIVFQHIFFNAVTKNVSQLSLHPAGALSKKAIDNQYSNMKVNGAEFIAVISGHIHRDYAIKTGKGYPVITTTCDASRNQASLYDPKNDKRQAGTITEQAFDVYHVDTAARKIYVTRIGAGSDRQFSY